MEEKLKRNRRGFTLIELVIVIAVIGILTAILVPTFVNLSGQAKEANDISLVTNLNKALAMAESEPEAAANKTLQHAVDDLKQEGFNASILLSKSDQQLVWNSKTNRFLLSGEADKEIEKGASPVDYFALVDSVPELSVQKYSMAPSAKWKGATEVTVKYSFDALETEGIKQINYINTSKQNVILRSNSAGTNITLDPYVDPSDDAQGDHIDFYGSVGQITGPKDSNGSFTGFTVASHSLKINGKTIGLMAEKGHVDLTDAIVDEDEEIIIFATGDQVKVSNPNGLSVHAHANSQTSADTMNNAETSTGVTWDYDGNSEQNSINDIHHHISLEESNAASEAGNLGSGPVDGADTWNYSNTVSNLIAEAVRKEEVEKGVHQHDYKSTGEYLENQEPTCLAAGMEKCECECGEVIYKKVPALGHDLIGTYCNRCHHPVAIVDEIPDYTIKDPANKPRMNIVPLTEIFGDPLGQLYLDVAYSFKTFKDNDESVLNSDQKYTLDQNSMSFIPDNENGTITANDIFEFFGTWACDFYVSFSDAVAENSCGLGGAYGDYTIGFLAPGLATGDDGSKIIPGNTEIPLLGSMTKSPWTYEMVAGFVKEFKCGFFNLSEENEGKTFTVILRMTNPNGAGKDPTLGVDLPDHFDVAVINYEIQAPSDENMEIVQAFMGSSD